MSRAQQWRRRLLGAAAAVSVGALLLSAGPAGATEVAAPGAAIGTAATPDAVTAAVPATPATPQVSLEPDNHPMGYQIALHDGVNPAATADVQPSDVGTQATVPGIDVSSYQGNVNWSSYWSQGKKFAYVKATEGTGYQNPNFTQQYDGSYKVGMIRGSYHYARPDLGSASAQAKYFVAHGGGWSKDGKTLPGTLDIEWGPNSACYGLSQSSMVAWIKSFSDTYHSLTTRWPVIYTATSWWTQCTGNKGDFSSTNPLWIARYASSAGALPPKWSFYTFWQYSSSPLDQDKFSADITQLKKLATG